MTSYTLRFFPPQTTVADVDPRMVAEYVGWLVRQRSHRGKPEERKTLSDSAVRNALKPLSTCLATARREGLIRDNPADGASLPHRPRVEDDEQKARPFPTVTVDDEEVDTMALVVSLVHERHRLMFELLAATGLRRSELLALESGHLHLDGERPYISVRQRVRRQKGKGLERRHSSRAFSS